MTTTAGTPAAAERCEPLRVTAQLAGPLVLREGLALDSMLAYVVALREQLPPPVVAEECMVVEIPIMRSPCGRYHLASFAVGAPDASERRWKNRRFPLAEAQVLGDAKVKRISQSLGRQKSYRVPYETTHFADDLLTWWCVGERERVADLLLSVSYLGRHRAVGQGRVRAWSVEPCDAWDGFPVVRDGRPLRPLPLDTPGLTDPCLALGVLTYPYWATARRELLAVPAPC